MKGRRPKPTHLRLLQGNPGKRPVNRNEPKPSGALVEPPLDLPAAAVTFWNEAIADAPHGLLKRLDTRTLAVWATAAWLHADAAKMLASSSLVVPGSKPWISKPHPALKALNQQAATLLRVAAEMGFTPSSRTRISLAAEGDEDNPFDQFRR